MRRLAILFVAACAAALASCSRTVLQDEISIVPLPMHVQRDEGSFALSGGCAVFLDEDEAEFRRIAAFLNGRLESAAGFTLPVRDAGGAPDGRGIFFMNTGLAPEAYTLRVQPDRVVVEYGDGAGAFYALQTLLQLFPPEILAGNRVKGNVRWELPCCYIEDRPRFGYRGMHLDVCLHYFDLEFLKKYIDIMAFHKVNRFHWHLTEDQGWRLEIKKYPLLTAKGQWRKETVVGSLRSGIYDSKPHGGFYTQEQVRELVEYAAGRYVTIVPEIEMPGHALAALACYPHLGCNPDKGYETATRWGVFKDVFCPKPETFVFLEDVLDEVFGMFPGTLVHIGGDECPKESWKECPDCQALIRSLGLKDEDGLQSWFISRIGKYVNSKGREIIGWDEILQGGLAPGAKVMSWRGEEGGIEAARMKHEVVMSPHEKYYLDYWQGDPDSEPLAMGGPTTLRTMYGYEPVPEVLTPVEASYIIGIEGCVWTEYMSDAEHVEYMAWPRMCAIAETGWSLSPKDWDSFARRLEGHLPRLDALQVGYCRNFFDPYIVFHKDTDADRVVTISVDAPDARIHYTLDGSVPTGESLLYDGPFVVNRSQTVSAAAFRDGVRIGEIKSKRF